MPNQVTVSAIMPTFNAAPYLRAAVDSVLGQTMTDWELIVVDDGSSDDSWAILATYADARIKRYRQTQNRGRGAARNEALARAKGRYIAICDSDDISLPNRFAKQVSFLDSHPEIDIVSSQMKYFWKASTPRIRVLYPEHPAAIQQRFARGKMAVAHAASMIRAECFERFGPYAEECKRAQDLEFFLRIRHECRFENLSDFLVMYRHELRGISFQKFMETARYGCYAVYRADAVSQGATMDVMNFDQYYQSWRTKIGCCAPAMLGLLKYQVRSYLPRPHVLR